MTKDQDVKSGRWFADLLMNFAPDPENIKVTGTPEEMIKSAGWEACLLSTSMSLPPGPLGLITILPEIIAVTKIQINLVYKIAQYYKKAQELNISILLLIFANAMNLTLGNRVIRKVGTRLVIKALSSQIVKKILEKIGIRIAAKISVRLVGRWVIGISALIFGLLSKHMTKKIGRAADQLFSQDIEFEKTVTCSNGHEVSDGSKYCPECGEKMKE